MQKRRRFAWLSRRMVLVLSLAVPALGVVAEPAWAGEYSAEVTIGPLKTFTAPSHAYYEVAACPIAHFDVAARAGAYLYFADALGNASNSIEPCVIAGGPTFNAAFTVQNDDPSNSRTFDVFGFY